MKIKIISDGTRQGTRIVNAKTGEEIEGVVSVEWDMSVRYGDFESQLTLEIANVQLELVGDAALQILPAYEAMALLQGRTKLEGVNEA